MKHTKPAEAAGIIFTALITLAAIVLLGLLFGLLNLFVGWQVAAGVVGALLVGFVVGALVVGWAREG